MQEKWQLVINCFITYDQKNNSKWLMANIGHFLNGHLLLGNIGQEL